MAKKLPVFKSDEEAEKFLEGDLTDHIDAKNLAPFPAELRPRSTATSMIPVAIIGAAHGLKGEVRVKALTGDPMAVADYGALRARDGRSFEIATARPAAGKSPEMLVVRFKGVDDRDAAEALNGVELLVPRDRLPETEADEFYHSDLIGLAAVTVAGEDLGTVIGVENFGAGDLLEVAPRRGQPILVPFTEAVVPEVNLKKKRVVIDPPPGLIGGDEDET